MRRDFGLFDKPALLVLLAQIALEAGLLCPMFGPAAHASGADWSTVGGDISNSRYSTLSQINVSNVKALGAAWNKTLDAPSRTPPVVAGGVLYINDASTIYALNATTGQTIWQYRPEASGPARGGVALDEGLVFCGLSDAHIVALDMKSGKLVWTGYIGNAPQGSGTEVHFPGPIPGFSPKVGIIINAPTYVNGTVVSGLSGGDAGARGKVAALDAKTGKLLWNFYIIPAAGAPGSETWPGNGEALQRGGGAVWTQGPADPELGLVFYGTGNTVPQLGGETRAGDNLYTASVVALKVKTGQLAWHFQLTHHDLWEMDVSTPLILYTAQINGHSHAALAAARTDGHLFLLDRRTGQPIFPIEERPVRQDARLRTAPTQPFPVGADRVGPDCVDPETAPKGFQLSCWFDPIYFDQPNVLFHLANVRQAPMSYDADTKYFFITAQVTSFWARRTENPYSLNLSRPPSSSEYGLYAAVDSRTRKIVWQRRSPWGLSGGSGALSTAGGLVFHMEGDGNLQANNARNGETLWQFQTGSISVPGGLNVTGGVPAATYEVDGVQYVAEVSDRALWAFRLGGAIPQPAAPPPPSRISGFDGLVRKLPDDGTGEIAIGAFAKPMRSSDDWGQTKSDDDAFEPGRAQVKAAVKFKWVNRSSKPRTISADDQSWSTGPIAPGQSREFSVAKPGTYEFSSQDTPWVKGQLIVR
jgi:glucose dehydrogenase/plastocyanin